MADADLADLGVSLDNLSLSYCEHRGDLGLREAIAADHDGIGPEDVLVTAGAAAALFIVHTTLLEKGDHLVVEHPNYGTNIETPRAIECEVELLRLTFATGFQPDLDGIAPTDPPEYAVDQRDESSQSHRRPQGGAGDRGAGHRRRGVRRPSAGRRDLPRRLCGHQAAARRGDRPARDLCVVDIESVRFARHPDWLDHLPGTPR